MATARGSNAKIYLKEQTVPDTAATGNFVQLPFKSFSLRGSQALSRDDLLGANVGRDGSAPYLGVINVAGDMVVPIDTVNFGYPVKGLMGAATVTGTTSKTHVFTSGKTALPSFTFEKAFPDVPAFDQYLGVMVGGMSFDLAPDGPANATVSLMGLDETTGTTSAAGTPTFTPGQRFMRPTGSIKKDGATLAQVVGGRINMSNNMSGVQTIRSDMRLEEIDFGNFTAGGDLRIRFRDNSLKAQAIASTPCTLEYSFTISATKLIKFEFAEVYLSRPGVEISGPAGLELPVTWEAAFGATAGYLARITIINDVASY